MFKKKPFYNLLLFIILLTIPTIWVIQKNPKVQNLIVNRLINFFQKKWDIKISINDFDLNFFTGKVLLKEGKVRSLKDCNKDFEWGFDKADIAFSRLAYFLKNKFILHVTFENVKVKTVFNNGNIAIKDHLEKVLFESTDLIKGKIKSFLVKNLQFILRQNQKDFVVFDIKGCFGFKRFKSFLGGQYWSGYSNIKDGNIFFNDKKIITELKGQSFFSGNESSHSKHPEDDTGEPVLSIPNGRIEGYRRINISKRFRCNYLNNDYLITTKDINDKRYIVIKDENEKQNIQFRLDQNDYSNISGSIDLHNIQQSFLKNPISIHGDIYIDLKDKKIKLSLTNNNASLENYLIGLAIEPKDLSIDLQIDSNLKIDGNYKAYISENDKDKKHQFTGSFFANKDNWKVYSKRGTNGSLILEGNIEPHFYLTKFLYEKNGRKVVNSLLQNNHNKTLVGKIDYSFVKSFFPFFIKEKLLGKNAIFFFELNQDNLAFLTGSLLFKGKLSILQGYNPLENAKVDFGIDVFEKKLTLNNFCMDFYKGKVVCPKAIFNFKNNNLFYSVPAPLQINDFLVNWKKIFYGILDGNLMISKGNQTNELGQNFLYVKGDVVFKKSLIKGDLNIDDLHKENLKLAVISPVISDNEFVVDFDINVKNEQLVKIQTSSLDAKAFCDINLHTQYVDSKFCSPKIIGVIDLQKGALKFLEHDLHIDYGKIQFLPHTSNDPIIDLLAKNRIKKYLINLQASGSLHNPKIVLESFPELSKKEILSLLIVGSEYASLKSELSTILMQGLNKFVEGNKTVLPKATSFFRKLTQPFRYIQITPNFVNQSNQGLIKGSVNINLNEQIHAQIQKNFNLRDDLYFQLEYLLTDDINFKVLKDQRGDIGAQMEFGFKF